MIIKKIIYWLLPIAALMLQMGLFKCVDFIFRLESFPPSLFAAITYILLYILAVFLVLVGYLIAYIYKIAMYKSIVLVYSMLFFFALEILIESKRYINYDYSTEDAIWIVVVSCLKGILIWNSYPVILSVLLHWYSKKIVYPED